MHEALLEPHSPVVQRVYPEYLTGDELEAMQRLYTVDAVEAYHAIIEGDAAKESLGRYFEAKARGLAATITDPDQKFWLVKQNGGVVGMAGYNSKRGLIHSVYISSDVRGQGYGNFLMSSVLEETSDNPPRSRIVQVASANVGAIKFYETLGFELTGRSKDWKVDGTAVIPEIELAI